MKHANIANLFVAQLVGGAFLSLSYSSQATAAQAAVAMPDYYSAEVAESVLKQGGNAVDAAIAVGFSLAVTLPEAGNIGGGGFMLIDHNGRSQFLDYRETAPQASHRDMYLDENGDVIKYSSLLGAKAAGTPGTVAGLWAAHQKYGKLPWKDLVQPAIELAEVGFNVHPQLAGDIKRTIGQMNGVKGFESNFADYFGAATTPGLFKQPELAMTLKRIAENGPDDFYKGTTARLLVQQMQKSGGLVSYDDLANYKVEWRSPHQFRWNGYDVLSAPPPSSGGIAIQQLLTLKQNLKDEFAGETLNSAKYVHLIAEIEKRVYADRADYLGDPDFHKVPVKALTAPDYLKRRAAEVNPDSISVTEDVKPGLYESEQTTHYSIVDQWGNSVSNTYTLNLSFGNRLVVEGAGFLLNNEMDDFSVKAGVPNAFGVVGGKANEIAPKKRMLSSMTPTIVKKNGQVEMVVGSPGGSTIITSVFQAIVNHLEYGLSANQAVNIPRFHHQLLPKDTIRFTQEPAEGVKAALEKSGYKIKLKGYGDLQAITVENGFYDAASDQQGRGVSRIINWDADKTEKKK